MTLRQSIQAAPTKTNEIIGKLATTSNQALKTRETLLGELSQELLSQIEIEESHLLPVLMKQAGTKQLATTAREGNKELRARLGDLESTPKDGDAFLEKLTELKKSFQAHVQGERNELLPAVLKALSDEEASGLAETLHRAAADMEDEKRQALRDDAAQATRDTQRAERVQDEQREANRAAKAAEKATRESIDDAAERVKQTSDALEAGVRRAGADFASKAESVASGVSGAAATFRQTSQEAIKDWGAVSVSSSGAFKAAADAGSVWLGLARKVMDLNRQAAERMLQVRSLSQLADLHRDYVAGSTRTWMEGSTEVLQLAQRASKQALNPLHERLGDPVPTAS